ncbi:MAG: glucokinase [Pseudomonadota bacterium]
MSGPVLVGDVGGTSVRFALACQDDGRVSVSGFQKLAGDDFPSFEEAIGAYIDQSQTTPQFALFAIAGPTDGQKGALTNRPWHICARDIRERFGLSDVRLVNDFVAMARAVPEVSASAFVPIKSGVPIKSEPILVAGPGTGLGMATLIGDPSVGWRVLSGEGGHAAYAPRTREEAELLFALQTQFDFVHNEIVCSGIGLEAVRRAISRVRGVDFVPMAATDVVEAAQRGDEVSLAVCQIRARALLGALGDMALSVSARGGVIVAGGVAQTLLSYLRAPESLARFTDRGARTAFISDVPISLLRLEEAPLIGAGALFFDTH